MKLRYDLIRRKRVEKGFSQEYIAYQLDISQSQYSKLENGVSVFDVDKLSKLLDTLGLEPLEIIEFSDKQKSLINERYSIYKKEDLSNMIFLTDDEKKQINGGYTIGALNFAFKRKHY